MRFHLSTLFWVIFVFAASMSFAGVWGIPLALYWVVLLWLAAGKARKQGTVQALEGLVAVTVGLTLVILCLLPLADGSPHAARRSQCTNNLKQIGLGIQNYRDQWKCLPPPVVYDASGQPLHSWRTLILPYMEQAALYAACDMRVPWNEGVNAPLLSPKLHVYACPSDIHWQDETNVHTSYVAIVGPGTVWDPNAKSPLKDTRILAVEMADSGIAWAEPNDLRLDDALAAIEEGDPGDAFPRSRHPHGFNVVLVDGSVRFLSAPVPRRLLHVLLTEGFDAVEARREVIERESEPMRHRWQEQLDAKARRANLLTAATVIVWLASVVGFGIHAFRLRRSTS